MPDRLTRALAGERYMLMCIIILTSINLIAFSSFERGYDARWTVVTMQTCALIWLFGLTMRTTFPDVKGLYIFEAFALTTFAGIQAALATATIAPFGGAYADPVLARMDTILIPFVSWPDAVQWLIDRPQAFRATNHVYTSVNWQAPALFLLLALTGRAEVMRRLTLAGGLSAVAGLLVFALMPARGAYIHHGFTRDDLPDLMVGLPFEFPVVLENLRNGTMDMLSDASISGLISFPSFHASTAVILAMGWSSFGRVAAPMIVLNAGVAVSAIPIGSHYFSDILAGVLLGFLSMKAAGTLLAGSNHQADESITAGHPVPSVG